jgi:Fe-S cluster assembly protein SufD
MASINAVKENEAHYLSTFSQLETKLADVGAPWVHKLRREAMDSFAELGFPTTRQEEWKYTSVAPIASTEFRLGHVAPVSSGVRWLKDLLGSEGPEPGRLALAAVSIPHQLRRVSLADLGCSRLTFLNGRYCPELSTPETLPKGVRAGSLAAALKGRLPSLEAHLARYADYKTHPFVALNTAFLEDGTFVEIPKGLVMEKPLHLLYISKANGQPTISHPRNLILVGPTSQAAIVETYVGLDEEVYFTNSVTELVVGADAVVDHCKVQQESDRSYHIGRVQVYLERSSSVSTHAIALGGALVREEVQTVLDGEGAEALLHGLYVTTGRQHVDNHTIIDHAKPHCNSRELYKGVLEGKSEGVFNGKIIVRKDAQKTDSKQSNKNLLLSEDAVVNTKPQLEIFADDVKCTHGATIGQMDAEAVFYLRSRGIGHEEARNLLTYAFANDIMERIRYEPLRERLKGGLFARLAKLQPAEEA